MKRLVIVFLTALTLLILAAPAQAHPDYRPYKAAMLVWFDHYTETVWFPTVLDAQDAGDPSAIRASCTFPQGDDTWLYPKRNRWDDGARSAAQFITAIEGPWPSSSFSPRLREILRPFLGYESWAAARARALRDHRHGGMRRVVGVRM